MFDRLQAIEKRYRELESLLGDPQVISKREMYQSILKEHSSLSSVVDLYHSYKKVKEEIESNRDLLNEEDSEIRELARCEIANLEVRLKELEDRLKILLLPKDPDDTRNVILEIRAGTGGDEAALFVADLFRMYSRYAMNEGWKVEVMSQHPTGIGGFKEIIALIEGKDVYSRLKFESGVHRVQRVPETEAQGRIHTSTVTVAVLPEAEEVEVELNPKDLRIDVFRSSGPGGQSVNTTDSAVRVTHLPTGIVVSCQDEKSQHKNKAKALKVLAARLLDMEREKQRSEIAKRRRTLVGTGERSERIRTYNFPQGRVTDHRINLTLYRLEEILEGDLNEIIDTLLTHSQAELLKEETLPVAKTGS